MGQVGLLGLIEIDEQSSAGPDRGLRLAGKVLQAGAELLSGRLHGPVGGEILLPAQLTAAVQPEAQEFPQLHILPGGRVQHRLPGGEAPQLVEEVLLPVPPQKGGGGHLAGGDEVADTSPVEMSQKHAPAPDPVRQTAAMKLFFPSSSMEASITVPGVTMRMISRSTSPLARAGSSICSQIATLYPLAMSRAR